jgi:diguanylate cyclase (GGDEF)-like protein
VAAPGAPAAAPLVVLLDDDDLRAQAVLAALVAFRVQRVTSREAAVELVRRDPDAAVILVDAQAEAGAVALCAEFGAQRPELRCAIITGEAASASEAIAAAGDPMAEAGVTARPWLVHRPWLAAALGQLVGQLLDGHRLAGDNRRLAGELAVAIHQLRDHERALEAQLETRGREITAATEQLAKMGHQLDALTLRDGLTGLYTHRAFQERLREEVARALRYGQPMSLLLCDIDGFATVNYDLGYQIGDDILRRVAVVLAEIESPDRVRTSDIVARYSGEEFVLLLPETNKAGALTKAARLRDAITATAMPGERKVSMSIGVACLPEDAADAESLLTAAESALRGAKRGGRGRVHFFSSGGPEERVTRPFDRMREPEVDRFRPYHERMPEVTAILQRDRSISCLLVDLSRLHRVELDLGIAHHTEIYDLAAKVLDGLRGSVLSLGDLICRTGDGDGYLIVLSPRTGQNRVDLEALGTQVERAVEQALAPMVSELMREQPRITVGTARVLGNSMLRPERLIARLAADAADSAKLARGRTALRDKATLQDIILGDGLTSVYQPIVDLGTGDIFGYEALTRGPRGTALESPATLFAIADEVDLTVELDRACFRGALRSAINLEPVHRLFVNLLPMSFYDAGFIEIEVGNLLSAAGLTPANIVFEITERLAIENFATFKRALGAYTAMGFGVAIDDVGTRHSNLETVMSLRPHFIKISDVLVRGIARSTVRREMLRSLRHIAATIDAVVVAEGIEAAEDVAVLRDLGLRYGQGYYMARPGPPFVQLRDGVRAELRSIVPSSHRPGTEADPDDDEDDRDLGLPVGTATGRVTIPIPRHAFGRADDEVTGDFSLPFNRRLPRASEPPGEVEAGAIGWRPLLDDEAASPDGSPPLLDSLRRPEPAAAENPPTEPGGPRRPGLN